MKHLNTPFPFFEKQKGKFMSFLLLQNPNIRTLETFLKISSSILPKD